LLSATEIESFRDQGFLVKRATFDADEIARLREGFTYIESLVEEGGIDPQYLSGKDREVHIHIQPQAGAADASVRCLRKVQWPSMSHPAFEQLRTSPKFAALLEPLIGTTLKQYINQINFKMPGGQIEFPWHQDIRPIPAFSAQVDNYVQTIIVVVRVDGEAPDPEWVSFFQAVAEQPQVYLKVSALVENSAQQPAPADTDYYRPTLDTLRAAFGEDRLFFGSNWPVCERSATYETCIGILRDYFEARDTSEKFVWDNAKACYGLPDHPQPASEGTDGPSD